MGQDIRRLVNLAYPTAPDDVREILPTEQFLDGLHNSDMRLKITQSRPIRALYRTPLEISFRVILGKHV
jgi:hypothetical protein